MPVEEDYDARALALPVDDESPEPVSSPVWSRRSASFRRSGSFSRTPPSSYRKFMNTCEKLGRSWTRQWDRMSLAKKIMFSVAGVTVFILTILFLVYNERIFHSFLPYAKKWRDITAGWLILWFLIFTVSFPPLIGYSSLLAIAGFVYGFPNGCVWLIPHHF